MENKEESLEDAWKRAGNYYKEKKYDEAIEVYHTIKDKEKFAYAELGKCYYIKRDYLKAIQYFTEPEYVVDLTGEELSLVINSYYNSDFVEGLNIFFKEHFTLIPEDFKIFIKGLVCLDIEKRITKARDIFNSIKNKDSLKRIHIIPRIKVSSNNKSKVNCCELITLLNTKIEELNKTVKINLGYVNQDITNKQFKLNLISSLLSRGSDKDIDDVILLCNNYISVIPTFKEAFYFLGKAYQLKGYTNEALINYRKALECKGDSNLEISCKPYTYDNERNKNIEIQIELSRLYLRNNNYNEAKNCLTDKKGTKEQLGIIFLTELNFQDFKTLETLRNAIGIASKKIDLIVYIWEREASLQNNIDSKSDSYKSLEVKSVQSDYTISSVSTIQKVTTNIIECPFDSNQIIKTDWRKEGDYYFKKDENYPNVIKEVSKELNGIPDGDCLLKPTSTMTIKEGVILLTIKRCKEGNLFNYLHTNKITLSLETKEKIILQIAKALLFLCEKNFTMIKLNPFNIFIDGMQGDIPNIKIGDFKEIEEDYSKIIKHKQWILEKNTKNYMYSLGVLMWEIFNQKVPKIGQLDMNIIPDDIPHHLFNLMIALLNKENYPDKIKNKDFLNLFFQETVQNSVTNYFRIKEINTVIENKEQINNMINNKDNCSELLHYLAYKQEGNILKIYTEYYEQTLKEYITKDNQYTIIENVIKLLQECKKEGHNINIFINTLDVNYIYVKSTEPLVLRLANYGDNLDLLNLLYPKAPNQKGKTIYQQLGYLIIDLLQLQYDQNKDYDKVDELIEELKQNSMFNDNISILIQALFADNPNISEIYEAYIQKK